MCEPPVRTCVGCRRRREKTALRRIAALPAGDVRYDARHDLPGRGAYLCPDRDCIDAASRRDAAALRRALRTGIDPSAALAALRTTLDATGRATDEPPNAAGSND